MTLGLFGAFIGGLLTILSPCSVMLLPAFFSYAFSRPAVLIARTGVFYAGLVTTLVPLGVLAGSLGAFVGRYRFEFIGWASVIVILLGASMVVGVRLPQIFRGRAVGGTGAAAVYFLGVVYGLAGGCAGPLLGAVLTVAALGGNAVHGGIMLLVFAAGMVVPLLAVALAWGQAPVLRRALRPREIRVGAWRNDLVSVLSGLITVVLGSFLLVTQGATSLGGLLGAADQVQLEIALKDAAAGVPDWVMYVASLLLACLIWVSIVAARNTRDRNEDAADTAASR